MDHLSCIIATRHDTDTKDCERVVIVPVSVEIAAQRQSLGIQSQ